MDRGENIVRMVKESKADGVVFLLLKFCDPHAFDYPYIKEMLDKENIPCMLLDMEAELPPQVNCRPVSKHSFRYYKNGHKQNRKRT